MASSEQPVQCQCDKAEMQSIFLVHVSFCCNSQARNLLKLTLSQTFFQRHWETKKASYSCSSIRVLWKQQTTLRTTVHAHTQMFQHLHEELARGEQGFQPSPHWNRSGLSLPSPHCVCELSKLKKEKRKAKRLPLQALSPLTDTLQNGTLSWGVTRCHTTRGVLNLRPSKAIDRDLTSRRKRGKE